MTHIPTEEKTNDFKSKQMKKETFFHGDMVMRRRGAEVKVYCYQMRQLDCKCMQMASPKLVNLEMTISAS